MYSNLAEFILERELRKRIDPAALWPGIPTQDNPQYKEAGFYPVVYAELAEYQMHDQEKAFRDGDTIRVPAVDIPIAEAKKQALGEIDALRTQKETSGMTLNLNGNLKKFSTSINSQIKVGNIKSTGDAKTRDWIMADGTVETLTKSQVESVFSAMQGHIETVFALQSHHCKEIAGAETVAEVRNIIQNARLAFG